MVIFMFTTECVYTINLCFISCSICFWENKGFRTHHSQFCLLKPLNTYGHLPNKCYQLIVCQDYKTDCLLCLTFPINTNTSNN